MVTETLLTLAREGDMVVLQCNRYLLACLLALGAFLGYLAVSQLLETFSAVKHWASKKSPTDPSY